MEALANYCSDDEQEENSCNKTADNIGNDFGNNSGSDSIRTGRHDTTVNHSERSRRPVAQCGNKSPQWRNEAAQSAQEKLLTHDKYSRSNLDEDFQKKGKRFDKTKDKRDYRDGSSRDTTENRSHYDHYEEHKHSNKKDDRSRHRDYRKDSRVDRRRYDNDYEDRLGSERCDSRKSNHKYYRDSSRSHYDDHHQKTSYDEKRDKHSSDDRRPHHSNEEEKTHRIKQSSSNPCKSKRNDKYERRHSRSRSRSRSRSPLQSSSHLHSASQIKQNNHEHTSQLNPSLDEQNSTNTQSTNNDNITGNIRKLPTARNFEYLVSTSFANSAKPTNQPVNVNAGNGVCGLTVATANATTTSTAAVKLPSYYNPNVINPNKYAQQVQKRKLLWGAKKSDDAISKWGNAQFSEDTDGKVASKFMRLMGIKNTSTTNTNTGATTESSSTGETEKKNPTTAPDIKHREAMFSTMEHQYEVARQVTHTMRGVGLGFSSQAKHL